MPCYHPLHAYAVLDEETGKRRLRFFKKRPDGELITEDTKDNILQVPCGQCIGCRLEYSRQWAMRCVLEAKQWEHNYFVTLTYDDAHLTMNEHHVVDEDTGEVIDSEYVPTLVPNELSAFVKRLREVMRREYDKTYIRFFGCGEYGDESRRPHFHIILFNCPLPDLQFYSAHEGYVYYKSAIIDRCWEQRGMTLISDFSFDTARYVAKYMLKKHKGLDRDFYDLNGIAPEFTRCSRRPGIGREYYEAHKEDIYKYDSLVFPGGYGKVVRSTPPKYFDRLFGEEDAETIAAIKAGRKDSAEWSMIQTLDNTSLAVDDYLEVLEQNRLFREAGSVRIL